MSQNSHTMLLFFDKKELHDTCLLVFYKLYKQEFDRALKYADKLNIDIEQTWTDDWFNQVVSAQPNFIRVDFETSTHYNLPLKLLKQLFNSGLRGAAIETFYDQVGEFSRYYFADGKLVDKKNLYTFVPDAEKAIEVQFESDTDDMECDRIAEPVPIDKLLKQEERNNKDAEEAVTALRNIVGLSRESGSNPVEFMKNVLLISAGGKGLLHAFVFGLVTILLFKGLWLWILLTLLLAVILPFLYIHRELKALDGDSGDDEELTNEEAGHAD